MTDRQLLQQILSGQEEIKAMLKDLVGEKSVLQQPLKYSERVAEMYARKAAQGRRGKS